ncbi:ankyrin repeat domain-containing protein [Aspergillus lucknowensis]|uniref:DYW family of nucleic acid deaminases-domain-containing protein n=1 Tax=Aspergillus lucknowensis TaxID=176173 RepID=A0ABR4M3N8_9EURO
MSSRPEAPVLRWNAKSFYVRCPHCEEVHRHGLNSYEPQTRVPHCENQEDYLCCFPFNEQGQVAYEIDKKRCRFVNVCFPLKSDEDEVDALAEELSAAARLTANGNADRGETDPRTEDARQVVVIKIGDDEPFNQKKITFVIADCVTGKSSNMVALLLERGAKVNAVNKHGTSPLMQAAFWGRLENVELLLKYGADMELRDDENRRAIDRAQPTRKNQQERSEHPVYREDTFNRDRDRKRIVRLLGGEVAKSGITYGNAPTLEQAAYYSFKLSPHRDALVLQGPIEKYPISSPWKTVARLERGGSFPSIGAMSGWSQSAIESVRVDNRQWTNEVSYISAVVGHYLQQDHDRDRDWFGQYYACHAEKQLIAYLLDHHVFLPRDTAPNSSTLGRSIDQHQDLIELSKKQPPVSLRDATIFISSPVCDDCKAFKEKVNSHFGLDIKLFEVK